VRRVWRIVQNGVPVFFAETLRQGVRIGCPVLAVFFFNLDIVLMVEQLVRLVTPSWDNSWRAFGDYGVSRQVPFGPFPYLPSLPCVALGDAEYLSWKRSAFDHPTRSFEEHGHADHDEQEQSFLFASGVLGWKPWRLREGEREELYSYWSWFAKRKSIFCTLRTVVKSLESLDLVSASLVVKGRENVSNQS
jgi:hypothetical protein